MLNKKRFDTANYDQQERASNENVSRDGEDRTRFAHSPQIYDSDKDNENDVNRNNKGCDLRDERNKRQDTGRHAHRYSEHIINHQRSSSYKARHSPKVI